MLQFTQIWQVSEATRLFGWFRLIVVIKLRVLFVFDEFDHQHNDLERNITTLTGTLGREIVWFVLSLFWLIVVMEFCGSVVFLSMRL